MRRWALAGGLGVALATLCLVALENRSPGLLLAQLAPRKDARGSRSAPVLYGNLSCPFEWSKYSCSHMGPPWRAQAELGRRWVEDRAGLLAMGFASPPRPGSRTLLVGDSLMRQLFISIACHATRDLASSRVDWQQSWPCHRTPNCVAHGEHSGFNVGPCGGEREEHAAAWRGSRAVRFLTGPRPHPRPPAPAPRRHRATARRANRVTAPPRRTQALWYSSTARSCTSCRWAGAPTRSRSATSSTASRASWRTPRTRSRSAAAPLWRRRARPRCRPPTPLF